MTGQGDPRAQGDDEKPGVGDSEPIRDIAAIWDVEVLSAFLGRDDLRPLIRRSLDHFRRLVVEGNGYAIVAPSGEQPSIAHSGRVAALTENEVALVARSQVENSGDVTGHVASGFIKSIKNGIDPPATWSSLLRTVLNVG